MKPREPGHQTAGYPQQNSRQAMVAERRNADRSQSRDDEPSPRNQLGAALLRRG
jgi:hypothetical protein